MRKIDTDLGKNAAYAIIASDLLSQGSEVSLVKLWSEVRRRYRSETGHEAAVTEQGEIRVVLALFLDKQLVKGLDRPA